MKRLEIDSLTSFFYKKASSILINEKAAESFDLAAFSISHYYLAILL